MYEGHHYYYGPINAPLALRGRARVEAVSE